MKWLICLLISAYVCLIINAFQTRGMNQKIKYLQNYEEGSIKILKEHETALAKEILLQRYEIEVLTEISK